MRISLWFPKTLDGRDFTVSAELPAFWLKQLCETFPTLPLNHTKIHLLTAEPKNTSHMQAQGRFRKKKNMNWLFRNMQAGYIF